MCKEKWRRGVKMKIDFYAPKKYYGTHALSYTGWILFVIFLFIVLPKTSTLGTTLELYLMLIVIPLFLWLLLFSIMLYIYGWVFNKKIKNEILLKNNLYDYFFDIGISFLPLTLIVCITIYFDKYLLFLIIPFLFIFIRLLKYVQRKMEKRL